MITDKQIIRKQVTRVFILYSMIIIGLLGIYGAFMLLAYKDLMSFYMWFALIVYVFMMLVGWFTYKVILPAQNPNFHEDLIRTYKIKNNIK